MQKTEIEKAAEIFQKLTCFENREMTQELFIQAMREYAAPKWVSVDNNEDIFDRESDPIVLFDDGSISYHSMSHKKTGGITHFLLQTPPTP